MNIMDIKLEGCSTFILKFNWFAVVIILILILVISFFIRQSVNFANRKSVTVEEVSLGIGKSSVKLSYNKKDQEIAYKIWVELSTRKIGLRFDQEMM